MKHSKVFTFLSFVTVMGGGFLFTQMSRHGQKEQAPQREQNERMANSIHMITASEQPMERQQAIERENNPTLPEGVPEFGAGLKRMKKFSQVEISPKLIKFWNIGARATSVTFSRDDKLLLVGSEYSEIYRTSDWKFSRILGGSGIADFSPNGKLVAANASSGVGIWRVSDGEPLRTFKDKSGLVERAGVWGPVAFSPDGRRLLTLGENPQTKWRPDGGGIGIAVTDASLNRQIAIKVWNVSSGKRLKVLPGPSWGVGDSASVAWVRTSTGKKGQFEPHYFGEGDGVCQLFDRTLSVQIKWQGYLAVQDLTTEQLIRNIPFGNRIEAAALSPDGALVASGGAGFNSESSSQGGMIKIWRVADGKLLAKFESKGGSTRAISFSHDGKNLVVVNRLDSGSGGIAAVYAL